MLDSRCSHPRFDIVQRQLESGNRNPEKSNNFSEIKIGKVKWM